MKINMIGNGHDFKKQNCMTLNDKKGQYDLYACSICGLQGKRRSFSSELEIRKKSKNIDCIGKPEQGNIEVKDLCEDDRIQFVDIFKVKSLKTAEDEIKAMINWFNSTLRPYELPRRFLKIVNDNK